MVKTVGGRSLVIKVGSDRGITVNDVPVTEIISAGDNQVNAEFQNFIILHILNSRFGLWVNCFSSDQRTLSWPSEE